MSNSGKFLRTCLVLLTSYVLFARRILVQRFREEFLGKCPPSLEKLRSPAPFAQHMGLHWQPVVARVFRFRYKHLLCVARSLVTFRQIIV